MAWLIRIDEEAENNISRLDRQMQKHIYTFLNKRLATRENPRSIGKALMGKHTGLWRYRVGDYRILCKIDDAIVTVVVITVGHRREVYH